MKPSLRPSEWHIALVRDSLIRIVYPVSNHLQVQDVRRRTAQRKMGKQLSFRKDVSRQYGLLGDDRQVRRDRLWNIASGDWEPSLRPHGKHKKGHPPLKEVDIAGATADELKAGLLQAAHIVPQCFGKKLFRRIFGDAYHDEAFWAPDNGLLLPRGVAEAMDNWSISIVPDDNDLQLQDFRFRVIDPTDELLGRRITFVKGDYRTGRDLDGAKVFFPKLFRPRPNYLYFNHCCAIVKKNRGLFQDAATDGAVLSFRNAEQERMQPEGGGAGGKVQHQPFEPEYDLPAFWTGMLNDLDRMDQNPDSTVVDWTMSLRYLLKVERFVDDAAMH